MSWINIILTQDSHINNQGWNRTIPYRTPYLCTGTNLRLFAIRTKIVH